MDPDGVADDPQTFAARILRGSYVRFGRTMPSSSHELGDNMAPSQQQKRSKHYVRFGRSPIDIDEYFYDETIDKKDDTDAQLSRRTPRSHYVRFGRESGNGHHYVRFGRNNGRPNRHYVRFGRDDKRAHYVRFGRGSELGLQQDVQESDSDRPIEADKRPNYVRFG